MTATQSPYLIPGWSVQSGPGGDNHTVDGGSAPPVVSAPVTSVNTHTGAVVLTSTDVSAIPTSAKGAASGVASLNGSSKLVQMPSASDVGAVAVPTPLSGAFANAGTATGTDAAVVNAITACLVALGVMHA